MAHRGGGGGKIPEIVENAVKKRMRKSDVDLSKGRTPGSRGPDAPNASSPRPDINTRVSQKQNRHLRDNPNYRGGGYVNSQADAQSVLDAVHNGEATVIGTTRSGHLLVRYDGVTGYNTNARAGYVDQPTNVFMIKGTSSPSVVPTSPDASASP